MPVGIESRLEVCVGEGVRAGILRMTGCVTSLDGGRHVEHTAEEEVRNLEEAEDVGARLAKVLIGSGAQAILDEITEDRERRAGDEAAIEQASV